MTTTRGFATLALAGLALTFGLAACSAPPTAEEPELETGNADTAYEEWRLDFDACLKAEGFDMSTMTSQSPDGQGEGITMEDVDMEKFTVAQEKCIEEIGEPPAQAGQPSDEELDAMMLVFAKCMREAGYDYPDPDPNSNSAQALPSDWDPAVIQACSDEAGMGQGGE